MIKNKINKVIHFLFDNLRLIYFTIITIFIIPSELKLDLSYVKPLVGSFGYVFS